MEKIGIRLEVVVTKNSAANLIADVVLKWYQQNKRILPWRKKPKDPYKIWISEIMLQQTTVSTVIPYFLRFMEKFPSRTSLAQTPLDEVFVIWSGLGYYRRASALHKTAQLLEQEPEQSLGQLWPSTPEQWRRFPGIGLYTSAAICAIAFDFPIIPIDGNISRIFSRLFWAELKDFLICPQVGSVSVKLDQAKVEEKAKYKRLTEKFVQEKVQQCRDVLTTSVGESVAFKEWGDLAQGFMDLGSLICQPRQPKCRQCPLQGLCAYESEQEDIQRDIQKSLKIKVDKPVRYGEAFCVFNEKGEILLQKETESSLLHGLWKVQTFSVSPFDSAESDVSHVFTHFVWKIKVHVVFRSFEGVEEVAGVAEVAGIEEVGGALSNESDEQLSKSKRALWRYFAYSELSQIALSSLTKKIIQKAIDKATDIKNNERAARQ